MSKFIDKISVPNEIAENETGLYHVIIVEASFNQAQLEAKYKAKVQKYDDRSWVAVKDRLKQIGYTNVYVIHDPTIKEGKQTGDAGNDGGVTAQEKRQALIEEAKALGYEGALNAKNSVFEEFIANAKANGENAGNDGNNDGDGGDE